MDKGKKIIVYKHPPYGGVFETFSFKKKKKSIIEGWLVGNMDTQDKECIKNDIGKRFHMEDRHIVVEKNGMYIYGVFDGHSSSKVSSYLEKNFPQFLFEMLNKINVYNVDAVKQTLKKAFVSFDQHMLINEIKGGSTAIIVLRIGNTLYFANLGDSRAILKYKNKLIFETIDHKPQFESEKERIRAAGGFVKNVRGISRVNGIYSLSRAFGDFEFKKSSTGKYLGEKSILSPVPDVSHHVLKNDVTLILGCDGVWDVMSSGEAVNLMSGKSNLISSCDAIVDDAIRRRSGDNITIMVMPLKKKI